ncbi:hypothetical protein ACTNCI_06095 [Mitsuokella jalaludinii]|uniref:hypothetical protein n=1 Tax=Mitsuokella jalaludinii TaxID=187979 RepID=UPI003F8BC818
MLNYLLTSKKETEVMPQTDFRSLLVHGICLSCLTVVRANPGADSLRQGGALWPEVRPWL